MIRPGYQENRLHAGTATLEILAGNNTVDGTVSPLDRIELSGEAVGPLLYGEMMFAFQAVPMLGTEITYEAVFRFPLPGDASVLHVEAICGSHIMETELQPKTTAQSLYQKAKDEGAEALLLLQESPDVFTLKLLGIQASEPITVRVAFVEMLRYDQDGWNLRLPLTLAPRYVRADEENRGRGQNPLDIKKDPGYRFALQIDIYGAETVRGVSHPVVAIPGPGCFRVSLEQGAILPDKDFVMGWFPRIVDKLSLSAYFHRDSKGDLSFMALLTPPKEGQDTLPREITLMVDHSGSMEGAKRQAADWAVEYCLQGLETDELFNLCVFDDHSHWFSRNPVQATLENVDSALNFLRTQYDGGGTELGVALEQAFRQKISRGLQPSHVLIITDAEVSDEARLIYLAGKRRNRRLSIVSIDPISNVWLVEEMVRQGGGIARYISSEPDAHDIAGVIESVMDELGRPLYSNCLLCVASAGKTLLERKLGDLAPGISRWLTGTMSEAPQEVKIQIFSENQVIVENSFDTTIAELPGVSVISGVNRIRRMETVLRLVEHQSEMGVSTLKAAATEVGFVTDVDSLYPDNAKGALMTSLQEQLAAESIKTGILSEETAMIAVTRGTGKVAGVCFEIASAAVKEWPARFSVNRPVFISPPRPPVSYHTHTLCDLVSSGRETSDVLLRTLDSAKKAIVPKEREKVIFDSSTDHGRQTSMGWLLRIWKKSENEYLQEIEGVSFSWTALTKPVGKILIFYAGEALPAITLNLAKMKPNKVRPVHIPQNKDELRFVWVGDRWLDIVPHGLVVSVYLTA